MPNKQTLVKYGSCVGEVWVGPTLGMELAGRVVPVAPPQFGKGPPCPRAGGLIVVHLYSHNRAPWTS